MGNTLRYLLILISVFPTLAFSTQSVELKFSYASSSLYTIEENTSSQMTMMYDGDPLDLSGELRKALPLSLKAEQEKTLTINTGDKSPDNNSYPISLIFNTNRTRLSAGGSDFQEQNPGDAGLEGLIVNGIVNSDGSISYSSMNRDISPSVPGYDPELHMRSMFDQLSNPEIADERPLKIGDSTSYNQPVRVPISDSESTTVEMETIYTLESIDNFIATFSIDFDVVVSSQMQENGIDAIGTGTGSMTYDTKKQISPSKSYKMDVRIEVPYKEHNLMITSTIESTSTVRSVAK